MATNSRLNHAKKAKTDEYYTQLTDIANELKHYRQHFAGKTVYCNCDDPRVSNFFQHFSYGFEHLKLKKLLATCYKNQNPDMLSKNEVEKAIYIEYKRNGNGELIPYPDYMKLISQPALYANIDNPNIPQPDDIGIGYLKGDGDFRSDECIELLKRADIVVTNPPFSLFREYIAQLVKYDKKFLILGDQNHITFKEVFKLFKDNKVWFGFNNGGTKWFGVLDEYDIETESRKKIVDGKKYFSMGRINWYTNLDISKRYEDLILTKKYSPEAYPKYDNYDAINVDRVNEIPENYPGEMGVPITFLTKHNPNQFELIGIDRPLVYELTGKVSRFLLNGKESYARIVIRNKKPLK